MQEKVDPENGWMAKTHFAVNCDEASLTAFMIMKIKYLLIKTVFNACYTIKNNCGFMLCFYYVNGLQ